MKTPVNSGGFSVFEFLIIVLFLSLLGWVAWFALSGDSNDGVVDETSACGDSLAHSLADEDSLSPVQGCWAENYNIEGKRYKLVEITYGEGEDCPSGCIYSHKTYLLDSANEEIQTFDAFYITPDLSLGSSDNACSYVFSNNLRALLIDDPNRINRQLIVEDGLFKWELTLDQFSGRRANDDEIYRDRGDKKCLRTGTIITSLDGEFERILGEPSFVIE